MRSRSNPLDLLRRFGAGPLLVVLLAFGSPARSDDAARTLKDAFVEHFLVGTALNRSQATGTGGGRRSQEEVDKDVALVQRQFNQISPENDLKWQLIHPLEGPDGYEFKAADAFVDFGRSHHMSVVGHTLVWHSQTPDWVFAGTNPPPAGALTEVPGTNAPGSRRSGRGAGAGFGRYTGPRASREELLGSSPLSVAG